MNRKKCKKIITALCLVGILILAFWYGGNAPGLQGFSISDSGAVQNQVEKGQEEGSQTEKNLMADSSSRRGEASQNTGQEQTEDDKNFFEKIIMQVRLVGSSGTSKNTQGSKRAQKNANKAAKKGSKTASGKKTTLKKKKSSKIDIASNTESQKNTATENPQSQLPNGEERNTADASTNGENNSTAGFATDTTETPAPGNGTNADRITCTIYISCGTVLDHMDELTDAKKKIIPKDGVILKTTSIVVKKNATVFDVLQAAAKQYNIHLEYNYTPAYKNYYIEGIGNLYEFDAGNLSGWMYSVNGEFSGTGCSSYKIKDGDAIKWLYTCNFGKDVGDYFEE